MIYTVTFNPAIDYVVQTTDFKIGSVNRSISEQIYFGGKGINVSIVLSRLEISSIALGFTAGFTGRAIEKGVAEAGIKTDFVHLENDCSRINVKIKSDSETELNGQGPDIPDKAIEALFEKLDDLRDGDILVLAGSVPNSLPMDIYEKILARLSRKKINSVVDASGKLLLNVLKYKPFLIKPNADELSEMFGAAISGKDDVVKYGKKLKEMGAQNVLVSLAGDGAVLIDEYGTVHIQRACIGKIKNSVGAGDSMVAGFIAGYFIKKEYAYALKLGTAAGGATAFSDGLAEKEKIFALLSQL
ncbi:MAG: 1-phosphofructokinase [Ruminiclostridium sp.]|nr:1-phosphofructokinase [Ruminiclostridium sp.]